MSSILSSLSSYLHPLSSLLSTSLSIPLYVLIGVLLIVPAIVLIVSYFIVESNPALPIKNRHYMITGGSSGIGLALAIRLARDGAFVSVIARNAEKLNFAVQSIRSNSQNANKNKIIGVAADIADEKSFDDAVATAVATNGPIQCLVCSAGMSHPGYFSEFTIGDYRKMFDVNFFGTVNTIRTVVAHMKDNINTIKNGRIIIVSSMAGQAGVIGYATYTPSKFALRGLAEVLHHECIPFNISVSVVNPPDVDTPMLAEENKIKPIETKKISEGAGVFSAEHIANDIMNKGIYSWKFLIQSGFDGHMLGLITSGVSPAHSPFYLLWEVLMMGIVRFVSVAYRKYYNSIVIYYHKQKINNQNKNKKRE